MMIWLASVEDYRLIDRDMVALVIPQRKRIESQHGLMQTAETILALLLSGF